FYDNYSTEIHTLSLHDALPILINRTSSEQPAPRRGIPPPVTVVVNTAVLVPASGTGPSLVPHRHSERRADAPALRTRWSRAPRRSEEHTSELQSRENLVCRLLL